MQWNVEEKSNKALFSLSLQDFAWSEHLGPWAKLRVTHAQWLEQDTTNLHFGK